MQDFINNNDSFETSLNTSQPDPKVSLSPDIQRQALIGRLTSNIVHELNNPMQAIRGSADLALEDLSNTEELKQYLKIIQQSSDRALSLISLVRSIYAPEHSSPCPIDLCYLLQTLLPIIKDDLNHKAMIVQVVPRESPVFIWGVESILQQSILNILLFINQKMVREKKRSYSIKVDENDSQGSICVLLPENFSQLEEWAHEDIQYSKNLIKEMRGEFTFENQGGKSHILLSFPLAFPKVNPGKKT
jgi:phosphoglycerate-specific signal transduction histidine kinase